MAISLLVIASFLDFYKREIHDVLWIAFGICAIIILFFEPDILNSLMRIGISLIITPVVILMWRLGVFGGADAFCLIVLAALAPQLTFSENPVTPFTTLTNAAILSILPLFFNLARNIAAILNKKDIFEGFEENTMRKIIAMFLGYRALNPKYSFSIETKTDNHKKLNFAFHHAENSEFCMTADTWVTPGIPYVLYLTAGFLVQIFMGDIIFNLAKNLFQF